MLSLNTENKVELKYDDKLGLVHTIIHVSGKFYLSDEFNNRILAFNESGILEHEYSKVKYPRDLACHHEALLVADAYNHRVIMLDYELNEINSDGFPMENLLQVSSIASIKGSVFAVERDRKQIVELNSSRIPEQFTLKNPKVGVEKVRLLPVLPYSQKIFSKNIIDAGNVRSMASGAEHTWVNSRNRMFLINDDGKVLRVFSTKGKSIYRPPIVSGKYLAFIDELKETINVIDANGRGAVLESLDNVKGIGQNQKGDLLVLQGNCIHVSHGISISAPQVILEEEILPEIHLPEGEHDFDNIFSSFKASSLSLAEYDFSLEHSVLEKWRKKIFVPAPLLDMTKVLAAKEISKVNEFHKFASLVSYFITEKLHSKEDLENEITRLYSDILRIKDNLLERSKEFEDGNVAINIYVNKYVAWMLQFTMIGQILRTIEYLDFHCAGVYQRKSQINCSNMDNYLIKNLSDENKEFLKLWLQTLNGYGKWQTSKIREIDDAKKVMQSVVNLLISHENLIQKDENPFPSPLPLTMDRLKNAVLEMGPNIFQKSLLEEVYASFAKGKKELSDTEIGEYFLAKLFSENNIVIEEFVEGKQLQQKIGNSRIIDYLIYLSKNQFAEEVSAACFVKRDLLYMQDLVSNDLNRFDLKTARALVGSGEVEEALKIYNKIDSAKLVPADHFLLSLLQGNSFDSALEIFHQVKEDYLQHLPQWVLSKVPLILDYNQLGSFSEYLTTCAESELVSYNYNISLYLNLLSSIGASEKRNYICEKYSARGLKNNIFDYWQVHPKVHRTDTISDSILELESLISLNGTNLFRETLLKTFRVIEGDSESTRESIATLNTISDTYQPEQDEFKLLLSKGEITKCYEFYDQLTAEQKNTVPVLRHRIETLKADLKLESAFVESIFGIFKHFLAVPPLVFHLHVLISLKRKREIGSFMRLFSHNISCIPHLGIIGMAYTQLDNNISAKRLFRNHLIGLPGGQASEEIVFNYRNLILKTQMNGKDIRFIQDITQNHDTDVTKILQGILTGIADPDLEKSYFESIDFSKSNPLKLAYALSLIRCKNFSEALPLLRQLMENYYLPLITSWAMGKTLKELEMKEELNILSKQAGEIPGFRESLTGEHF